MMKTVALTAAFVFTCFAEAGPVLSRDKSYVVERETFTIVYPFPAVVAALDAHSVALIEIFDAVRDARVLLSRDLRDETELSVFANVKREDNPNCKSAAMTLRGPQIGLLEFSMFVDPNLSDKPIVAYDFIANCDVDSVIGKERYPLLSYSPGNCDTCGNDRYWLEADSVSGALRLMHERGQGAE